MLFLFKIFIDHFDIKLNNNRNLKIILNQLNILIFIIHLNWKR